MIIATWELSGPGDRRIAARCRCDSALDGASTASSSKTCACCGSVKAGLALSQRIFTCDTRGYAADRDLNAARNLERLTASSAVTACGEERSGAGRKPRVKRGPAKQAPDSKAAA
ncbi:zinc ribbon domain-containing protein [Phenylobacterium sp.]|uniref:zinc ribbon domain-containing protein n=1 Tax=Phenylobacterium sp. TaxID=1871053 RepID=UPI002F5CC942